MFDEKYELIPNDEQMVVDDSGEINSISEIQERLERDDEDFEIVDPHEDNPLSEQMNIQENVEITGQDITDKISGEDVNDNTSNGTEINEAKAMSLDELLMTDEELAEHKSLSPKSDIKEKAEDLEETEEDFENSFAEKINKLSLNELKAERENLIKIGALDGNEIAELYDSLKAEKDLKKQLDDITEGFNSDQLESVKEKLINCDKEIEDLFGLNDISEEGGAQKIKTR